MELDHFELVAEIVSPFSVTLAYAFPMLDKYAIKGLMLPAVSDWSRNASCYTEAYARPVMRSFLIIDNLT